MKNKLSFILAICFLCSCASQTSNKSEVTRNSKTAKAETTKSQATKGETTKSEIKEINKEEAFQIILKHFEAIRNNDREAYNSIRPKEQFSDKENWKYGQEMILEIKDVERISDRIFSKGDIIFIPVTYKQKMHKNFLPVNKMKPGDNNVETTFVIKRVDSGAYKIINRANYIMDQKYMEAYK